MRPADGQKVSPFAWRPVTLAMIAAAAALIATISQYGYHRDELYFLVASRHLAFGYDDQPPLTPLLIRLETTLFGDSVTAIRIVPMLSALALIALTALCARELAGPDARRSRRAQAIGAVSAASSLLVLFGGHLFVTANLDFLSWSVLIWLLLRWLRTGQNWLWPIIGAVAGLGLENNNLVVLLAFSLVLAVAIAGPREIFGNRAVWLAALIALLIWAPNLWWQAAHGFPELKMAGSISSWSERGNLIPFQIETALFLTPVWLAGWWRLARSPDTTRYRLLAWGFVIVLVVVFLTGGKRYYPAGWYPLLLGGGSVTVSDWLDRATSAARRSLLVTGIALTAICAVLVGLPSLPVRTYAAIAGINGDLAETVGWPQFAGTVSAVYHSLPPAERRSASLIANNYGEAGALDRFGPALGLPTPYAPHAGYARFGRPSGSGPTVAVGWDPGALDQYFAGCTVAARIDNGFGVDNQEQGRIVEICRGPREPWSQLWPALLHYS